MASDLEWIDNRPGRIGASRLLRELFTERDLVVLLARRSIKARTQQSFLGLFWPVAQPIVSAITFFLVFNQLAGIEDSTIPYPLFVFVGSMVWGFISAGTISGTNSIANNAGVVGKTYFPRVVLPTSACLAASLGIAISSFLLGILLVVYRPKIGLSILTLPLWFFALTVLVLGHAFLFSTLNVRSRDVSQVVGYLNQIWLYASPVAYPSSLVPDGWKNLYYLNPLAGILDGFRWALFGSELSWRILISLSVVLILWIVSLYIFGRTERTMADHL